jgi:hypothetical protein
MVLHRITELYAELFSVFSTITSKFHSVAMFKIFVEQNNDSNKTCMSIIVSAPGVNCITISATVHELSP